MNDFIPSTSGFNVLLVKRYTHQMIKENPDKFFVFGDNMLRKGFAGQAMIRPYPNTIGIRTKKYPSMREHSFFSDQKDEFRMVKEDLEKIRAVLENGGCIVLPADGIGSGLARMDEKSPRLFRIIVNFFKQLHPEYMKEG